MGGLGIDSFTIHPAEYHVHIYMHTPLFPRRTPSCHFHLLCIYLTSRRVKPATISSLCNAPTIKQPSIFWSNEPLRPRSHRPHHHHLHLRAHSFSHYLHQVAKLLPCIVATASVVGPSRPSCSLSALLLASRPLPPFPASPVAIYTRHE